MDTPAYSGDRIRERETERERERERQGLQKVALLKSPQVGKVRTKCGEWDRVDVSH